LKDLHINQEPDELETLTSGFELEVRGGDIPIDYNFETLSFEGFVSKIHELFDRLPDHRRFSPNLRYSIKEAALGAFAMFFSQAPSFLA
jgi:hypothetical protein